MTDSTAARNDAVSMAEPSCSKDELSVAKFNTTGDQSILESQIVIIDVALEKKLVRKFDLK